MSNSFDIIPKPQNLLFECFRYNELSWILIAHCFISPSPIQHFIFKFKLSHHDQRAFVLLLWRQSILQSWYGYQTRGLVFFNYTLVWYQDPFWWILLAPWTLLLQTNIYWMKQERFHSCRLWRKGEKKRMRSQIFSCCPAEGGVCPKKAI